MAIVEEIRAEDEIEPSTETKKRRRPSGEPPPLPRDLASAKIWLGFTAVVFLSWIAILVIAGAGAGLARVEVTALEHIALIRTDWLTRVARALHSLGSEWLVLVLRWLVIGSVLYFKRFRHLFVFIGSIFAVGLVGAIINQSLVRPRPLNVEILGHWEGASQPSRPIAALAVTLIGIAYTMVVPGKSRMVAKWATGVLLLLLGISRLYLGVDHPTDVIGGIVVGVAIPLVAFRSLTPNEIFPVSYKKRRAAHLDVEGHRGDAIRNAIEQQIGVTVVDIEPFGLGGSAGSTPLRLTLAGEPAQQLFAKLYAQNHLRADRWYKLGRTLLYGRMEDESSFSTVRRLVQYEDYLLRVMRDAELPSPRPYGIVEITPEREYLLLTDFVSGAHELLDAEITDDVISQCMAIVRKLWDSGLAHRDVKPSNLLVAKGKVHLIDVAFGEVRPSPWRQAVDLANMMMVLSLRTDPRRVYEAALVHFTEAEVAEAFAATRGMTVPSQTKSLMKKAGRDLVKEFRALTRWTRPISIQRWSLRRLGLTFGVFIAAVLVASIAFANIPGAGLFPPPEGASSANSGVLRAPMCDDLSDQLILIAQSVPSASLVPCVGDLPVGWSFAGADVVDGRTRIFLDSDRAGFRAVRITFTRGCDLRGATEVLSDEPDTRRYERVTLRRDRFAGTRYYVFDGGCAAYDFDFAGVGRSALAEEVSVAMSFVVKEEGQRVLSRLDPSLFIR